MENEPVSTSWGPGRDVPPPALVQSHVEHRGEVQLVWVLLP